MNWGNRLLLTFIVFGAGMCYLVYRSMHTNYELVEKNYYKTELNYQSVIDATRRAGELKTAVSFEQQGKGMVLHIPGEMKSKNIKGTVWFYCAYDATRDRKFTLNLKDDDEKSVPLPGVLAGTYIVKMSWTCEDKDYYSESNLTVL